MLDRGVPPAALAKRPELHADLMPVWNAFQALRRERPQGVAGIAALPAGQIVTWLREIEGVRDPELLRSRVRLIRAMDDEMIAFHREKQPKE